MIGDKSGNAATKWRKRECSLNLFNSLGWQMPQSDFSEFPSASRVSDHSISFFNWPDTNSLQFLMIPGEIDRSASLYYRAWTEFESGSGWFDSITTCILHRKDCYQRAFYVPEQRFIWTGIRNINFPIPVSEPVSRMLKSSDVIVLLYKSLANPELEMLSHLTSFDNFWLSENLVNLAWFEIFSQTEQYCSSEFRLFARKLPSRLFETLIVKKCYGWKTDYILRSTRKITEIDRLYSVSEISIQMEYCLMVLIWK
jgi:hypothetical protein